MAGKIKRFLEKEGVKENESLIESINQQQLQAEKEWERQQKERRKDRFCDKCNKSVKTYDGSYDYDDGWFTRIVMKCSICNTVLFETTEQN